MDENNANNMDENVDNENDENAGENDENVDNENDENADDDNDAKFVHGYNSHDDPYSSSRRINIVEDDTRQDRRSRYISNNCQWIKAEEWAVGGKPKNITSLIENQSSQGIAVKWYNDQNSDFIGHMENDGIHEPDHVVQEGFEPKIHTSFTSFGVAAKQYIYNKIGVKPPSWMGHIASRNATQGGVRFCEDINTDASIKRAVCDGWTRVLVQCNISC